VSGTILIYGATGYTGKLIAKAAAERPRTPWPPLDASTCTLPAS
jgi:short subunit dehydrogenase-like uncharacterized protein